MSTIAFIELNCLIIIWGLILVYIAKCYPFKGTFFKTEEELPSNTTCYNVNDDEFKYTSLLTGRYYINFKEDRLMNCSTYELYYIKDHSDFEKVAIYFNWDHDGEFFYVISDQNGRINKIYNW